VTCIVATRSGIWADRRVSNGPTVFRPGTKVARGDGIVAAFCGTNAACAKAMKAVRAGETDVADLAAIADGLVVTEEGKIYELFNGLVERTPAREAFAVNGSGFAEAAAFLSGAQDCSEATVKAALKYVATVRSDCGDGINGLTF
jgi:hypothetical protein